MKTLRVACVQMRSTANIGTNVAAMEALVRSAAEKGAAYVQTPEMTGIVQRKRKALFSEITNQDNDNLIMAASNLASELGIWLHIGSHAVVVEPELAANRAFLFQPDGSIAAMYDKIHMFDVDLDNGESWRESKVYRPGNSCGIVETGQIKLGLSICYDLRFPHLYREQALAGAEVLAVPAAFTRQTGQAHWHTLLRARAIENGAFVVAAAQGGAHDDGRETYGHSVIINPWGEVIAEVPGEEPGVLVADLDMKEVLSARAKIPNLANGRDFVVEKMPILNKVPA